MCLLLVWLCNICSAWNVSLFETHLNQENRIQSILVLFSLFNFKERDLSCSKTLVYYLLHMVLTSYASTSIGNNIIMPYHRLMGAFCFLLCSIYQVDLKLDCDKWWLWKCPHEVCSYIFYYLVWSYGLVKLPGYMFLYSIQQLLINQPISLGNMHRKVFGLWW